MERLFWKAICFTGRCGLLVIMAALALVVMAVSAITGLSAEQVAPSKFREVLELVPYIDFLATPASVALILLLPFGVALVVWNQALRNLWNVVKKAGKGAWRFLRGDEKQRRGDTLWGFLQIGSGVSAVVLPLGFSWAMAWDPNKFEPQHHDPVPPTTAEVQQKVVPVVKYIYFAKGGLDRTGTFLERGFDVKAPANTLLTESVDNLRISERVRVEACPEGFVSDKGFKNLSKEKSQRRQLELADYRAAAVAEMLKGLKDDDRDWLTVCDLKRWTPAFSSPKNVETAFGEMIEERDKAILQKMPRGVERDHESDRVVVIKWTVEEADQ